MDTELPLSIPFRDVESALGGLGIPTDHAVSVTFGTDAVTVEQVRRDPVMGRFVAAGNNLATVTTVIGYERTAD